MPLDADQPTTQTVESLRPDQTTESDYVIAHVLFLDIVGFTKLVSGKQRLVLRKLQEIVRETKEFCTAQNKEQLIALATGDGMALVFLTTEGGSSPAKSCAEKIAIGIKDYNQTADDDSKLKVRMGINTGNVIKVIDINNQRNVAGAGINLAQRVMDCGDTGHILLSQQAYDLLPDEQKKHCRAFENEVIVKHGHTVLLHNLLSNGIGNAETPTKIRQQIKKRVEEIKAKAEAQEQQERMARGLAEAQKKARRRKVWGAAALSLIVLAVSISIFVVWRNQPSPSVPSFSLAVLPFQPGTEKNSSKAISDALQEQFNRGFKRLTTIDPLPLSTVRDTLNQKAPGQPDLSPLEVGKRLKVRYVLTGTAEASNDDPLDNISNDKPPDFMVEVHVVLYDTEAGKPVWETPYKSRPFYQLIDLQKEIVKEVTEKMGGTMRKQEDTDVDEEKVYTQKAGAYWYYLLGRFLFKERLSSKNSEAVAQKAISSYKKATDIDNNYALAHAGLADAYNTLSGDSMNPVTAKDEALKEAKIALSSGAAQPEVYAAIGTEKWWLERDYTTAQIALLLATKLQPDAANSYKRYSSFLAVLGKKTEAEKQILEALKIEPNSSILHFTSGQNYFFARDNENAIDQLMQAVTINPKTFDAHRFLALALEQLGKYDEALEHLKAAKSESTTTENSDILGARGHILAHTNQVTEALKIAHEMEKLRGKNGIYVSPYNIALIYAEIPDRWKDAFFWLDRAIDEFDPRVNWLKVDPRFDRLHQDKAQTDKFESRLKKVGLP